MGYNEGKPMISGLVISAWRVLIPFPPVVVIAVMVEPELGFIRTASNNCVGKLESDR